MEFITLAIAGISSLSSIGTIIAILQYRKESKKLSEEAIKREGYKQRCDEEIRSDINNLGDRIRKVEENVNTHENLFGQLSTSMDWIKETLSEIKQKLN